MGLAAHVVHATIVMIVFADHVAHAMIGFPILGRAFAYISRRKSAQTLNMRNDI